MAARSMRSQAYLASEALLPVKDHGLNTADQLRSHTEKFQRAKIEISQGKRRRRNSENDTRKQETIRSDGPDIRFEDIQLPDSGLRDGLVARFYMPPFPNVQDFTRRSARWEDKEQLSASQDDDSEVSGPNPASAPSKRASRKDTIDGALLAESIIYKCYAKGCKYEHSRRGNFSIHWKRDAKHAGMFDLKMVLHCSQDRQNGSITTIPYGQVKVYRQRRSSGPKDDISDEETTAKVSAITIEPPSGLYKKRKAPADEELPRQTRTRSSAVSAPNSETRLQRLDKTTGDGQTHLAKTSNPRLYSSLECQIFKRLTDVPVNFPTHLAPLISHGVPDAKSADKPTSDCRYFCPECQKCFTQPHNVASHFSRAHGKKYSENDRAHTVCCRATVSQSRVNIDAKPIDETILPRLVQIRQQRSRSTLSSADSSVPVSDTDHGGREDAPFSLRRDKAVPASFLLNTIEAVIPERPILAFSFTTPLGVNQPALSPRQSSERIRRMQAVREAIFSHTDAPALTTVNGSDGQPEDSRTAAATDMQSSTNGDYHRERDEGTGTTSHEHDTSDFVRQPSWHDMGQPTPGQNSHKRKRTASIATDKYGEDRSSEGAGKLRGPSDTEGFDVKDVEAAIITQTTKAAEAQMGGGMGPKESSRHLADSESLSEHPGQVSGPDEQIEDLEVLRVPEKRRKMTLAEYITLERGIGAQPEKA